MRKTLDAFSVVHDQELDESQQKTGRVSDGNGFEIFKVGAGPIKRVVTDLKKTQILEAANEHDVWMKTKI